MTEGIGKNNPSNRPIIKSRCDAYDYIAKGAPAFHIMEAVALYLLETEVRATLQTRKSNIGEDFHEISEKEIDALIKADYNVHHLDEFKEQAFKDLEKYTRAAHMTYSIEEVLRPHVIEKYLIPLSNGKTFIKIPSGVWQGMWGNIMTVVVVLLCYVLAYMYRKYSDINLVQIILNLF